VFQVSRDFISRIRHEEVYRFYMSILHPVRRMYAVSSLSCCSIIGVQDFTVYSSPTMFREDREASSSLEIDPGYLASSASMFDSVPSPAPKPGHPRMKAVRVPVPDGNAESVNYRRRSGSETPLLGPRVDSPKQSWASWLCCRCFASSSSPSNASFSDDSNNLSNRSPLLPASASRSGYG
jgi:hypothetical protein